jgi:hypothetical protein
VIAIPDGYKSAGDLDIEVKAAVGAVIYEHNYLSDLGPREQILDLYEEDCVLTERKPSGNGICVGYG